MRFVRTILALVIAASLTLLPINASAAGFMMGQDDAESSVYMGASTDMSMDDFCPDDMKGSPAQTDHYKCPMGFCCAGTMALSDVRAIGLQFPPAAASRVGIVADQFVPTHGGSPPFRPPRA
jgi:hypothetical protein